MTQSMRDLASIIPPSTYTISNEDLQKTCAMLRKDIIGSNVALHTPFGKRRIVYTDFTATGRSLFLIQKFLTLKVLPYYANTHTLSNGTAGQTTHFRTEARRIIKKYLNAIEKHALIFTGAGSTSAFHKFLTLMEKSEWNIPAGDSTDGGISYKNRYYTESLRGAFFCDLCSCGFRNIAAYEEHTLSEKHQKAKAELNKISSTAMRKRRIVIICDPTAHHSNLLPFREIVAKWSKSGSSQVSLELVELKMKSETCTLCLKELREELIRIKKSTSSMCFSIPIVILSAVSNVTGLCLNLYAINELIHLYGGLACWDFSSLASHGMIDFAGLKNPHSSADSSIDVGFFSTHKFLGGPGSSGFLVLKKTLLSNPVPSCVGGGVVFFVSKESQVYIKDKEEREEAGTPNILGDIQAGLVYQLHSLIPVNLIISRERQFSVFLRKSWIHHSKIVLLGPQDLDIAARFNHEEIESQTCIITFLIRYGNTTKTCSNKGLFLHHGFIVKLLNDLFGIQARGGCACAGPLAHHLLGLQQSQVKEIQRCLTFSGHEILRPGFVRISLHFTMSWEEIQMIDTAVKFIADYGWMFLPLYTFSAESGEWYHRFFRKKDTEQRSWLAELNLKDIMANYVEKTVNEEGTNEARGSIDITERFNLIYEIEKDNQTKPRLCDYDLPVEQQLASQERSQIPALHALIDENTSILKTVYSNENRQSLSVAVDNIPVFRKEWICLIWFALPADAAFSLLNGKECCLIPHFTLDASRPQHSFFFSQSNCFAKTCLKSLVEQADIPSAGLAHRLEKSYVNTRPLISDGPQLSPMSSKIILDYLTIPRKMRRKLGEAIRDFHMIQKGDQILVGLSGGKDSLTLLHVLRDLQRRSPVPFSLAAATVDPQTPEYNPKPLEKYLECLGSIAPNIKYHLLSVPIIKLAKEHMQRQSICAFCSRMKRGILYSCMKKNGYNVLALGQHLDDMAESFIMSAFQNGRLNTMKAHYTTKNITIRVCRPLVYVREKALAEFAEMNRLPVISENCPGCFANPTERHRAKLLLLQEEYKNPSLFQNLLKTLKPLLSIGTCGTHLNEMHDTPLTYLQPTEETEEDEGNDIACCATTEYRR